MTGIAEGSRRLLNWVNLSTPIGLTIARLGGCVVQPGPAGLILAENYRFGFPVAGAFTVGNVVITPHTWAELLRRHPQLLDHEARHATQWAACWGLPFLPLYGLAMAWSWARSADRASHNVFEVAAGLRSGGYQRQPGRRLFGRWGARGPLR